MVALVQDHGAFVSDRIDIEGFAGGTQAYTGTAGTTAGLAEGVYDVSSDQNCFIAVNATATTATGYRLLQNNVVSVLVRQGSTLSAIRDTVSGTLWYHKVA